MKKTIFYLVAAIAVLACSKTEENEVVVEPQKLVYTLYGTIAQETGTKVVIHDNEDNDPHTFSHYWEKDDVISVFSGSGGEGGSPYTVTEESAGSSAGTFTGSFGVGDTFYAIYPYNSGNAVDDSGDNPAFTVTYPAAQTLTEGSYDPAANVYVATGADTELTFYNTTAYLRLAIYTTSEGVSVSKIELTSLGENQPIAGTGTVTLNTGEKKTTASVTVTDASIITLTPKDNVAVELDQTTDDNNKQLKYFYIAVPAVNYDSFGGYQVRIYSGSGDSETYQFRNISAALSPNTVRLMSPLEYNPVSSGSTATLVTGSSFNEKIKTLAGDEKGTQTYFYYVADTEVTAIKFETRKNMTGLASKGVDLSKDEDGSIIATIKNGVVTISTSAESITTQSCSYIFMNFRAVETIEGLENLRVNSGYMNYMFYNCLKLTSVDMSNTQLTGGFVRQMTQAFYKCSEITEITLPTTEFSVNAFSGTFQDCPKLISINNLKKVRTYSSLENVSKLFYNCEKLESVSFNSNFTCSGVTNISEMFSGCSGLTGPLDLSNFNTAAVTNASKMFYGCSSLTGITFGTNCTFADCTDMSYMFYDCDGLTSLDLRSFDTKKVSVINYMFANSSNLTSIDLSGENCSTASIKAAANTTYFIASCYKLQTLKLGSSFNFSSSNMSYYFWPIPGNMNTQNDNNALHILCDQTTANNLLRKGGVLSGSGECRVATGINNGKFVLKNLDGSANWKFYVDEEHTNEVLIGNVAKTNYVWLPE